MNEDKTIRPIQATKYLAAIFILMVAFGSYTLGQDNILQQEVTVKMINVKKQAVFRSLTRQTGLTFTFDTELIKPQEFISVEIEKESLESVLNTMFPDNIFGYSVIENHIIIYKKINNNTPLIKEEGKSPVYLISGNVVEASSFKALPYATVGIYKKGLGTISNEEGFFSLKVTENSLDDSLRISYLGFMPRTIPVRQAIENHFVIELKRDYIPIPEVIIRSREPVGLINNVLKNTRANYGSTPAMLKAFYRESVSRRNKFQLYSEAVINIYKSSYTRPLQTDQINIHKSRKIENVDITDTLIIKLQSGLYACLQLDGIKNMYDFINPLNHSDYDYRMTDIVNIGDEAAYVVDFAQKEIIRDVALFRGSIYINTDNYGVHSCEFEINPDFIDIMSDSYIRESAPGYSVKLREVKYSVNYRNINGRFYLNHVRGDLGFFARKKKKFFGSNYNITFEMAVTDIDTLNVSRFSRDVVAPRQSVLWETIDQYDPDFWGTENYMQPELSIQEAMKQINARLGKYIKED